MQKPQIQENQNKKEEKLPVEKISQETENKIGEEKTQNQIKKEDEKENSEKQNSESIKQEQSDLPHKNEDSPHEETLTQTLHTFDEETTETKPETQSAPAVEKTGEIASDQKPVNAEHVEQDNKPAEVHPSEPLNGQTSEQTNSHVPATEGEKPTEEIKDLDAKTEHVVEHNPTQEQKPDHVEHQTPQEQKPEHVEPHVSQEQKPVHVEPHSQTHNEKQPDQHTEKQTETTTTVQHYKEENKEKLEKEIKEEKEVKEVKEVKETKTHEHDTHTPQKAPRALDKGSNQTTTEKPQTESKTSALKPIADHAPSNGWKHIPTAVALLYSAHHKIPIHSFFLRDASFVAKLWSKTVEKLTQLQSLNSPEPENTQIEQHLLLLLWLDLAVPQVTFSEIKDYPSPFLPLIHILDRLNYRRVPSIFYFALCALLRFSSNDVLCEKLSQIVDAEEQFEILPVMSGAALDYLLVLIMALAEIFIQAGDARSVETALMSITNNLVKHAAQVKEHTVYFLFKLIDQIETDPRVLAVPALARILFSLFAFVQRAILLHTSKNPHMAAFFLYHRASFAHALELAKAFPPEALQGQTFDFSALSAFLDFAQKKGHAKEEPEPLESLTAFVTKEAGSFTHPSVNNSWKVNYLQSNSESFIKHFNTSIEKACVRSHPGLKLDVFTKLTN